MATNVHLPPSGSVFDTDTNCSLDTCPLDRSIYTYRPSLAANVIFIVLFGISMLLHIAQGLKWKTWWYSGCMTLGCICEIIGYGGRVMVWQNPFSFNGFLLQIICITIAPAFFTAAIYLTLSEVVIYLGPRFGRFPPRFYLYVFVPCDIVALTLQGTGGGMSSSASDNSNAQTGVNISIAGLAFQVATLSIFSLLAGDFFFRYARGFDKMSARSQWTTRFQLFLGFLGLAIVLIFIRCAYRINELKDGYSGGSFHEEGIFIGLESVMITIATFALNIAHPGPIFPAKGSGAAIGEDLEGEQEIKNSRN